MKRINIILVCVSVLPLLFAFGMSIYNQPKKFVFVDNSVRTMTKELMVVPPLEASNDVSMTAAVPTIVLRNVIISIPSPLPKVLEEKVWVCNSERESVYGGKVKECEYKPASSIN